MRQRLVTLTLALLCLLALLGACESIGSVQAATGSASYAIEWSSIDSGGAVPGNVYATRYTLGGTIGQHDAGTLSSGTLRIDGGFWAGIDPRYLGALPLVQR